MVGTTPIGAPFLGWPADAVGGRAPLVLGGVVCLIAAAFGFVAIRRHSASLPPVEDVPTGSVMWPSDEPARSRPRVAQHPPPGPTTPGPSCGSSTVPTFDGRTYGPRWTTYQTPRQEMSEKTPNENLRPPTRYTSRVPGRCQ